MDDQTVADPLAVFERIAELPPGLERRQLMKQIGMNITAADFSDDERQDS